MTEDDLLMKHLFLKIIVGEVPSIEWLEKDIKRLEDIIKRSYEAIKND